MKGYEYIAKHWLAYGVKDIFLVPTNLFDSLVELEGKGVNRILTHSEKAAAYMADAYAQASGRPGIVITQGGPGAPNLVAGLGEPYQSSTPVIAYTGARPPSQTYRAAYQDVTPHFESVTKFDGVVGRTDRLPDLLARAFHEATVGDPRPVHLAIDPGAEAGEADLPEPVADPRFTSYPAIRIEPVMSDVDAAVDMLKRAAKPVIIAGGGAMTSGAWPELIELAERLQIPVATSLSGKGAINENHPLSVGVVGTYCRRCANDVVMASDVALIVGTRTGGQSTDMWKIPPPATDIIHINIDPREPGKNFPFNTKVGLAADAKVTLSHMLERLGETRVRSSEWAAEAERVVRRWREAKEPVLSSNAAPIRPERICRDLTETLPQDALIVCDTGYAATWAGAFLELHQPGKRFFRCEGSLGWAVPAALGVKAAQPDKPVICFTGDGGLWYHLAELETAKRYGLDIIYIVLNNHALAMDTHILDFRFEAKAYELAEFTDVDFAAMARAFGCNGKRVIDAEQLAPAIREALNTKGVTVLDILSDHDAVAPVTTREHMSGKDRMVFDDAGDVVTSLGKNVGVAAG